MTTRLNSIYLLLLTFVAAGPAFAAPSPQQDAADLASLYAELDSKMQQVDEQQRELIDKMKEVEQQRRELEAEVYRVEPDGGPRGDGRAANTDAGERSAQQAGSASGAAGAAAATNPTRVGDEQKAEVEAQQETIPDLPRISDTIGGVLTPRGRLVLEPSLRYLHSSVNRVSIEGLTILPALLVGVIDVLEADRDTYSAGLTARYGLTSRLEFEAQASYLWRQDSTRTRKFLESATEESMTSASGSGLGDVEVGMRYQFNRGGGSWPFLVGNLRVKSDTGTDPFELTTKATLSGDAQFANELPTGSGFWSVNPSLTFIYPSDPVVFFGNVGYLWTIEDDKGTFEQVNENGDITTVGFGVVDPGDALRMSFGMGLGLNDRSSLSLSYSLDLFNETSIETAATKKIAGSDVTVGRLLIGYSLRTEGGTPLNIAVGIGATEDAPDADLNFRLPITLFK
ncbi:MAG: transporter [Gammaproteobacteria bacterium]